MLISFEMKSHLSLYTWHICLKSNWYRKINSTHRCYKRIKSCQRMQLLVKMIPPIQNYLTIYLLEYKPIPEPSTISFSFFDWVGFEHSIRFFSGWEVPSSNIDNSHSDLLHKIGGLCSSHASNAKDTCVRESVRVLNIFLSFKPSG